LPSAVQVELDRDLRLSSLAGDFGGAGCGH